MILLMRDVRVRRINGLLRESPPRKHIHLKISHLISSKRAKRSSSSFLQLPIEIRLLIYDTILSDHGRVQHIMMDKRQIISYSRCHTPAPAHFPTDVHENPYRCTCKDSSVARDPLLDLRLTCRKLYNEALPLYYAYTTFIYHTYFAPRRFSRPFPHYHFRRICNLQLHLAICVADFSAQPYIDNSPRIGGIKIALWRIMWEQISRMPELRCLAASIIGLDAWPDELRIGEEEEWNIVAPLMQVKQPKSWRLKVNWRLSTEGQMASSGQEEEVPFTEFVRSYLVKDYS